MLSEPALLPGELIQLLGWNDLGIQGCLLGTAAKDHRHQGGVIHQLCESLEMLGDRYAIYGFSGTTRKSCEIYHIKHLDEDYNDKVKARISGITVKDYRQKGIHPYCITIDKEAGNYLPHIYGATNYVLIEDISKLPHKVSDIYRKLTTLFPMIIHPPAAANETINVYATRVIW